MSYNTASTRRKSTYLFDLDCRTTGQVKYAGTPGEEIVFYATITTDEAIETGECIAMVRVERGFTVTDMALYHTDLDNATIGVGDPFCCGRFLGPILGSVPSGTYIVGSPSGTQGCTSMHRLTKINRAGDGCGFGYTFTCQTDIVITNGYGNNTFQQGGGSVSGTTMGGGNDGPIPTGAVLGLRVVGYVNPAFTSPA